MGKHYAHLSCEERAMIRAKLELGFKPRARARALASKPRVSRKLVVASPW